MRSFYLLCGLFVGFANSTMFAIEVGFEHPEDSREFSTYSEQLGLVLWSGSIGVGGTGGAKASNRTDFTYHESFQLDEVGKKADVSFAFKTANFTAPSDGYESIASVYLATNADGPNVSVSQFSMEFIVGRTDFGLFYGVAPQMPPSSGGILPYLEAAQFSELLGTNWYELSLSVGPMNVLGEIGYTGILRDLGPSGTSAPRTVASTTSSFPYQFRLAFQPNIFAGFSTEGQAAVSAFDNFQLNAPGVGPELVTATLVPIADAQLIPGDRYPLGALNEPDLIVDGGDGGLYPRIDALMEFSLANIPLGAVVEGVTLNLTPLQTSSMVIEVLAYAGDGVLSLSDEFAAAEVVGRSPNSFADGANLAIELDPDFLQSILGVHSHIGLRLKASAVDEFTWLASMDSEEEAGPSLEIKYVAPGLPGDFNSDGQVNLADYTVWRDSLGQAGAGLAADGNRDSVVDALDYAVWKENFGQDSPDFQSSSIVAVPEPTGFLLSTIILSIACCRSVRTRDAS